MSKNQALRPQIAKFDFWIVATAAVLVFVGLVAIYDTSVVAAHRDFGDRFYYFKNQLLWVGIGSIALGFFSLFDYHKLLKMSPLILGICLLLLILVLVPGIGAKVYGARRWINIAGFTFQPSELAKLAILLYGSSIIAKFKDYKIKLGDIFLVLFLPTIFAIALVLIQPDLGTALIFIGIILVIYFIGGGPIWHFLMAIPAVLVGGIMAILSQPYRLERLKSFIDPSYDPQGASYQINQIIIALASGKIFGVGLGASRSKFAFIPEVHSDAIFAIIVEELGFIGAVFLISLFLFLVSRAVKIAKRARDFEGKILAMGIVGLISIQSLLNLGSIVALVPLTGVPLPFISYGGSSLFVTMIAIGILVNIRWQS